MRYLGEVGVTLLVAPADFAERDIVDLSLDEEAGQARVAVTGIGALAQRERIAVKNVIVGYLQSGTRSAEADVVLPVGPAGEDMLYTLRFLSGRNEVTVESLGSAADLLPATGPRSDVRHIPGYPIGANRAQVLQWLHKRYPVLSVHGKTADDVVASADRAVERQSTTVHWFEANYQIAVLDVEAADRRLAKCTDARASNEEVYANSTQLSYVRSRWCYSGSASAVSRSCAEQRSSVNGPPVRLRRLVIQPTECRSPATPSHAPLSLKRAIHTVSSRPRL